MAIFKSHHKPYLYSLSVFCLFCSRIAFCPIYPLAKVHYEYCIINIIQWSWKYLITTGADTFFFQRADQIVFTCSSYLCTLLLLTCSNCVYFLLQTLVRFLKSLLLPASVIAFIGVIVHVSLTEVMIYCFIVGSGCLFWRQICKTCKNFKIWWFSVHFCCLITAYLLLLVKETSPMHISCTEILMCSLCKYQISVQVHWFEKFIKQKVNVLSFIHDREAK